MRVRACLAAVAKARGIDRHCDLFPDFGASLKILRNNTGVMLKLPNGRWPVEGKVKTQGPKEPFTVVLIRGILREAVLLESSFAVLPLIYVSLPAFIGPGRGAKS